VLERIAGELRSGRNEKSTLLEDEQRLARLVEEIGRVLAGRPGAGHARDAREPARPAGESPLAAGRTEGSFSALRGRLGFPVAGEIAQRRTAPGRTAAPGAKGVFLRAREGDAVRAVAAGRVVYADWMRGFGNLLIVDHGEAYLSIYGNNESLLKQPGEAVSAGESIATVGASGGNEESGLYFELRHLGKSFDPLRWLKRR
jgi:septal ring factor EnvC (AmiA/AmiB activator)